MHVAFADPSAPVVGIGVTDDDDDSGDDGLSVGEIIAIVASAIVVVFGGAGCYLVRIEVIHVHCCRD